MHVKYNVEAPQLLWLTDALLRHLPNAMRRIWSDDLENAWVCALDIIVIVMVCVCDSGGSVWYFGLFRASALNPKWTLLWAELWNGESATGLCFVFALGSG